MEMVTSWSFLMMMLLGGGGMGVPLGVPPLPEDPVLAKIAPEDCLLYFSSSGMAKPDSKSTNQTEKLFAEPEVQAAVAEVEKLIRASSRSRPRRASRRSKRWRRPALFWSRRS